MNSSLPLTAGMAAIEPPECLAEALEHLVRGGLGDDVPAYLDCIATEATVAGTKTLIRWHKLTHDATLNNPQIDKLVGKLFKLLIDFACSRTEFEEARKKLEQNRTAEGFSALQEKARRLFTTSKKTGEVGEILLYFLAERLLRYPQVLCKMPHKTNPNVHAHGADGVHASVHPTNGHLRLHWGEAKLYAGIDAALEDCFSSLAELLLSPPKAKKTKTRDVELLRDHVDLDNPQLEEALRAYLDPDQQLSNKVEFCGLALVGFNLRDYDALCADFIAQKAAEISSRVGSWEAKLKSAVEKHKLAGVTVDAFCIPFQSVQALRSEFLKVLGVKNANQ